MTERGADPAVGEVTETKPSDRGVAVSTAISLLVAAAALLPLLGHKPLADWDEAIYAEIAREQLGHHGFYLTWHFQPWFEKPPLYMWLTAACLRLFSVNEFWARAVAALSGVALTGLIHGLLARVRGLAAAWTSTVILLTTLGFVRACHLGEVDTLLALGCYLSLWGMGRIRVGRLDGWYLFWFGLAVAVMTKGAAAVVVPLTLVVLLVWERWPRGWFDRRFWLGGVLFLALVLPWHVEMYREFGMPFFREYLGKQTLARATSQLEHHNNPPWFFVEVLLAFASPWIFVFPFAVWSGWRRRELREFTVFALVVFALFTASQTRLPRYVVPMYPAIALVTADGICQWISAASSAGRRQIWHSWWRVAAAAAASFALAAVMTRGLRERVTSESTSSAVVHADRNFLPLLRAEANLPIAEPVLLCQDNGWMQLPSAIFYTRKRVQQVWLKEKPDATGRPPRYYDAQPLANFVGQQPRLLLIPKDMVAELPSTMRFDELREAGDLVIGTVISR
jgi:4-amino-4-deoxy-L-arabinose transferase-like glycosyltransferase